MGEVYFYHLTDSPLEATLPPLLDKARGQGWRIVIRGTDAPRMARLDEQLWEGPPDSFRAHGLAGAGADADQPILLGVGLKASGFECVISVDGADLTAQEAAICTRACILFNGHDESALAKARTQWKDLTGQGIAAQYWAQDEGRWTKKADSR